MESRRNRRPVFIIVDCLIRPIRVMSLTFDVRNTVVSHSTFMWCYLFYSLVWFLFFSQFKMRAHKKNESHKRKTNAANKNVLQIHSIVYSFTDRWMHKQIWTHVSQVANDNQLKQSFLFVDRNFALFWNRLKYASIHMWVQVDFEWLSWQNETFVIFKWI